MDSFFAAVSYTVETLRLCNSLRSLQLCQPRLDASGFNRNVYSRNFLKTLKRKTEDQYARGLLDGVPRFSIEKVRAATTIGEFDDAVVAPVYGFKDKVRREDDDEDGVPSSVS